MTAAKAEVATSFRQLDSPDQLALRIKDGNTVQLLRSHPPSDPQIAVNIDAKSVWSAVFFGSD